MKPHLRHHKHLESPEASFMEKVSEAVASGMGTVGFIVGSSAVLIAWVLSNHVVKFLSASWKGLLHGQGFDPAPFILLNLIFSGVAFYTGALVIIAQKAQTRADKATAEADALHREELAQNQLTLIKQNTELTDHIRDLLEQNTQLTQQVHELLQKGST